MSVVCMLTDCTAPVIIGLTIGLTETNLRIPDAQLQAWLDTT